MHIFLKNGLKIKQLLYSRNSKYQIKTNVLSKLLNVFNLILSLNYNFKTQHVHILTQFTSSTFEVWFK